MDNVRLDFSSTNATPTDSEIRDALPSLRQRLERTTSNVILALGAQALQALTGHKSIDHYRGSILESTLLPGRKVIAAWHPAHIQHGAFERVFLLERDLRRAVEQSSFPEIRRPHRDFLIDPTYAQACERLEALAKRFVIDVECPITVLDTLYCKGFADSANSAMCIPFTWGRMSAHELADVFRRIQRIYEGAEVIGQNIGFDIWRSERAGFRLPDRPYFDTMLAHHLLWPEAGVRHQSDQGQDKFEGGHDLGFLCSVYTEEPYFKNLGKSWNTQSPPNLYQFWRYNCLDASTTYEIYEREREELEEFNQWKYFQEHVMGLVRPVMRMQQRGLQVDRAALARVRTRMDLELKAMQLRLNHEVGFPCNVKSPVDMRFLLKETLGVTSGKQTKKGAPSVDKDTLLTLAYGSTHAPIFKAILDIRERRTLLSGFYQLETNEIGRYNAVYKVHGTDSGRLSSTSPKDFEGRRGPQLQNIPKPARAIFIASPGHVLIVADLRRAEAHFAAAVAGEEVLLRAFEDPSRDVYCEQGANILNCSAEDVKGKVRECFKQTILGANYGLGPRRYISVLRLKGVDIEDIPLRGISAPESKAKFFLNSYYEANPGIRDVFQKEAMAKVRATRTLTDRVFGRRRFFMGRLDDPHTARVVFSYEPQAVVTGITNAALRTLDAQGWSILLQVHDALGLEVPIELFEEGWSALGTALTRTITVRDRQTTIGVDIGWGWNWLDLHKKEEWRGGLVAEAIP